LNLSEGKGDKTASLGFRCRHFVATEKKKGLTLRLSPSGKIGGAASLESAL